MLQWPGSAFRKQPTSLRETTLVEGCGCQLLFAIAMVQPAAASLLEESNLPPQHTVDLAELPDLPAK